MIDQCVRTVSGGKLFKDLQTIFDSGVIENIKYVEELVGSEVFKQIEEKQQNTFNKVFNIIKDDPRSIFLVLQMIRTRVILRFLPKIFVSTNVSKASVGEKHFWIYDFNYLYENMKKQGFENISKVEFDSTLHHENIFKRLDIKNSFPRKGIHQLFIEAKKN